MKKVLLLGATGMLGSAVYDTLKDKYDLILTFRKLEESRLLNERYGRIDNHRIEELDLEYMYQDYYDKKGNPGEYFNNFLKKIGNVDCVINTIGITIPYSFKNPALTFFINSAFPHILANIFGEKSIHITTDCVFNGKEGFPYDENSPHSPVDIYGISKSLGDSKNCLTLRTSIIGRELQSFTGLLEWFLQQEGKTIKGLTQHFWNGITTREFGKICDKIMSNPEKYPPKGIYHVFSTTLSKYEMLLKFKEKYNIDCKIIPDDSTGINRTLTTIYPLCSQLQIPSFDEMLKEF
ncbi:MAG: sugar nucleotide-binding protein [bacterium]|nr:sugar nucleotide-binding protein [bacterium]